MLRLALAFLFIGILAYVLGLYSLAGISVELGKIIFIIFLIISITTFIYMLLSGRNPKNMI